MDDENILSDIEIYDRCAEALYLSEVSPSALSVKPWSDADARVIGHCLRRARAVVDLYETLKSQQQADS